MSSCRYLEDLGPVLPSPKAMRDIRRQPSPALHSVDSTKAQMQSAATNHANAMNALQSHKKLISIIVRFWNSKRSDYWKHFLWHKKLMSTIAWFCASKPDDLRWRKKLMSIILRFWASKRDDYWRESPVTQGIDVNSRWVLEFKTQRLLKACPVAQQIDVNNRSDLELKHSDYWQHLLWHM